MLDPSIQILGPNDMPFIYSQLRHLTAAMLRCKATNARVSDTDMLGFSKARSMITHTLLCSVVDFGMEDAEQIPEEIYAFEAQRLAALIYVNSGLTECSSPAGVMYRALKSQLVGTLEAAERMQPGIRYQRKTSLWCLVVGGILALDNDEEIWFATRIMQAIRNLGVASWEEVIAILEEVVWVNSLTVSAQSLWRRIRGLQELQEEEFQVDGVYDDHSE